MDALTRTRPSQVVLHLKRVPADLFRVAAEYRGLCWMYSRRKARKETS